jgi:hypothetical protein
MQIEPTAPPAHRTPDAGSTRWWQWLLTVAGHLLFVVFVYAALYCVGLLDNPYSDKTVATWDAGWYASIRDVGYSANPGGQSNVAFFPLFPYTWRVLGLSYLGISLVNIAVLMLGAVWLSRTLGLRRWQLLLLLSMPPLFFGAVPYSEALSFLFGAILLRGLHRRQLGFTLLGLLGCCLTRSATMIFIPAFILSELLACTSRADLPRLVGGLAAGLLVIAGAMAGVLYMHFLVTGSFWEFFEAQKQWGHEFHWPLPSRIRSSAGIPVLGLDLLALLASCLSVLTGLWLGVRWLRGWWQAQPPVAPSRAVVFSLVYCGGVIAAVVVYQSGDLANSSRYVLATPYFALLVTQLTGWQRLSRRLQALWVGGAGLLALGLAVWCGAPMRFPGFLPSQALFFFGCWLAYVSWYLLAYTSWRYDRETRTGLYVVNVVYMAFLLNSFLGSIWVG